MTMTRKPSLSGDIEAIKEQVLWAASRDVGHALEDVARGFNRRTRNQFFSVTMEVKRLNTRRPFFQREDQSDQEGDAAYCPQRKDKAGVSATQAATVTCRCLRSAESFSSTWSSEKCSTIFAA
jgi:hypothetical protein